MISLGRTRPPSSASHSAGSEPAQSGHPLELAVLGVWAALALVALSCIGLRVGYPYALEWMEGNQWYFSYRVAHGMPVYADPNASGFLPYPYPPLYGWVAGFALRVLGDALWPARLVSVGCMFACLALIGRAVWRGSGSRFAAWTAPCFFLGFYGILDTWYDLIRVDMLYVVLALAAFVLWAEKPNSALHALGGLLLLGVSTLAKQPGLLLFLGALALVAARRLRFWPILLLVAISATAGMQYLVHARTHGWYTLWVWKLPGVHDIQWQRFWPGGVARAARISALFLGAAWLAWRALRRSSTGKAVESVQELDAGVDRRLRTSLSTWALGLVAAFFACAVPYSKVGGSVNNWTLYASVVSIVAGVALGRLRRLAPEAGGRTPRARMLGYLAILLQAGLCVYNPRAEVPTRADRQAGDRLVTMLSGIHGEVYVMDDSYLAWRAGKNPYMGGMTLADFQYSGDPPPSALAERLRRRDFTAILLRYDATDPRHEYPVPALIRENYTGRKIAIEYASESTFLPVAGGHYKPRWLLFRPGE